MPAFTLAGTMKILTPILSGAAFAALIGMLFKILHWPGGSFLLILSLGTIANLFLIRATKADGISVKAGELAGAFISVGLLFKIMHWPNAQQLLYMALGLGLLSLAINVFGKKKEENN